MLRWLRRILAVIAILIALSVLVPLAYIEGTCRPSSGAAAAGAPAVTLPAIDEPGYRRKLNNTFFTFPEWYIVYSFEDFGRFLDRSSESHFNYLGHIFGFWRSFCTINRAVPATGESLTEVKTMIYIIGISYSVEYAVKGFYENTIGRVFEWIRGEKRTPQDEFGRAVLQDYAAFLYTIPWYKYPFREKLDGLMAISAPTPSSLRSWERDFALGAEYFVKIGYASLIQKALDAGGDDEPRDIMFVVATLPPARAGEGAAHQADPRANAAMAAGADAALQGLHRDPAEPAGSGFWPCGDRRQSRHPHHGDRARCRQTRHQGHDGAVFAGAGCPARLSQGRPEGEDRPSCRYQPRAQGQGREH